MATTSDLTLMEGRLKSDIGAVRTELTLIEVRLTSEIKLVEERLKTTIARSVQSNTLVVLGILLPVIVVAVLLQHLWK